MSLLVLFFLALLISAVGTLPPGLITLTIVQTTVQEGKKAGMLNALGASIPEFIYAYIVLAGAETLRQNATLDYYIQLASVIIFLVLALWFWFSKQKELTSEPAVTAARRKFFLRGVAAGFFNFLIVPFWLFIIVWLQANDFTVEGQPTIILFSLGAALGALLVFTVYIEAGAWLLKKFAEAGKYINKTVGVLFFLLFSYQLWQVIG
jgi:threonine/homoserine/homoserine lactone efflux protein